jgi:hypothetical protein
MHSPLRGEKEREGSMSSTSVPATLLAIPEIHELNQILETGEAAPFEIIEVTLDPLSPQQRTVLKIYFQKLEENSDYIVEHHVFEDKEVVLITVVPVETMTLVSGNA